MKKQTPSTFILNVDDNSYVFVEGKNHALYGPMYDVYYAADEKPYRYNASTFIDVHGMHDKISVSNFLTKAILDLTTVGKRNNMMDLTYNIFNDSLKEVRKDDIKHPSLGNMKHHFIKGLENYNELINLLPKDPEISYIDEYNRINNRQSVKQITKQIVKEPRKTVQSITYNTEYTKARQRVKKYE